MMLFLPPAAAIGPPSTVKVTPVNSLLEVVISDPLTITNSSMKEYVPNMYYFIEYWKKSSSTQVCMHMHIHTHKHSHTLYMPHMHLYLIIALLMSFKIELEVDA